MNPSLAKRTTTVVLLTTAIAAAVFFAISTAWTVRAMPRPGFAVAAEAGLLRVHIFDPIECGMQYPRGFSSQPRNGLPLGWIPRAWRDHDVLNIHAEAPLIAVAFLFAGAWRLARARGWHLHDWQCKGCGYDVRGLTGGICTECGKPIAATAS